MGIDSQIKEMIQLVEREGLKVVTLKRESHSAKETGQRPVFNEIVEELRAEKFNGILIWAPDRISRNTGDLGQIVDLMFIGHTDCLGNRDTKLTYYQCGASVNSLSKCNSRLS